MCRIAVKKPANSSGFLSSLPASGGAGLSLPPPPGGGSSFGLAPPPSSTSSQVGPWYTNIDASRQLHGTLASHHLHQSNIPCQQSVQPSWKLQEEFATAVFRKCHSGSKVLRSHEALATANSNVHDEEQAGPHVYIAVVEVTNIITYISERGTALTCKPA